MNELKGKFVNIVLSVDEGRGFDSVKSPFYITANFNGRIMESDIVQSHPTVVFNTEMVWETEKKLLRKARGSYARVRLECYTTERKFVGFALLCLRSAKIIANSSKNLDVQYVWNKLLNVPNDFKRGTPELSVSLTIRDFIATKAIPPPHLKQSPTPSLPKLPALQVDHVRVPVKYTDDGFIQLGNDSQNLETYQLKLTILVASNLDVLLPEDLVFSEKAKQFYLVFEVFGMDVKTRQLTRDLDEDTTFNETVVINLQSNYNYLGIYFQHFSKINVKFFNEDVLIAATEIDMSQIGWNIEPAVFYNWFDGKLAMEQVCYFENHVKHKNPAMLGRRASLTTRCNIEMVYDPTKNAAEAGECSTNVSLSSGPEGEPLVGALRTIATNRRGYLKRIDEISETSHVSLVDNRTISDKVTVVSDKALSDDKSVTTIPSDNKTESITVNTDDFKESTIFDVHQQFCVDIILDAIFWKEEPPTTRFLLMFMHPKVSTHLQLALEIEKDTHKSILLENAVCKLMLTTSKARLADLLANSCPRMELRNAATNELIGEPVLLKCSKLNYDKLETSYVVTLRSFTGKELADINVSMFLEEYEMAYQCVSKYDLVPHILDDCLVMESLQELEEWKEQKRKQFEDDLYETRQNEIKKLYGEWSDRKVRLESALLENIERCKKLSHELKKSTQNLRIDRVVQHRRLSDHQYNPYLEHHKNSIRYALSENHELIEKISELEVEVAVLRDLLTEQSLVMKEMQKTQLTTEQTKTLLKDLKSMEERYEIAVKDKNYYKREYEKAAKEVHELKVEDHRNIAEKIAHDKELLSQFTLDTFAACITTLLEEGFCATDDNHVGVGNKSGAENKTNTVGNNTVNSEEEEEEEEEDDGAYGGLSRALADAYSRSTDAYEGVLSGAYGEEGAAYGGDDGAYGTPYASASVGPHSHGQSEDNDDDDGGYVGDEGAGGDVGHDAE